MGVFSSLIFKRVTKRVGNLVFYRSRGINIVKETPDVVRNPRTIAQSKNRLRFSTITNISGIFGETLMTGFSKGYITHAMNAFVHENIDKVTVTDELAVSVDYRRLMFARGTLAPPEVQMRVDVERGVWIFTSKPQVLSAKAMRDDRIYLMIFEVKCEEVICELWKTRRDTIELEIPIPKWWDIKQVYIYTYAVAASRRRMSDSTLVYSGSED